MLEYWSESIKSFHSSNKTPEIRTEEYVYADKTRYIELLESMPEKYAVILRSRRFGNPLFAYYYDQRHTDEFEAIFKGTYIYDHPSPPGIFRATFCCSAKTAASARLPVP